MLADELSFAHVWVLCMQQETTTVFCCSYQLVGVNFLTLLARSGVGGAIMADEMGLGKTAQAIAFLGAPACPQYVSCSELSSMLLILWSSGSS